MKKTISILLKIINVLMPIMFFSFTVIEPINKCSRLGLDFELCTSKGVIIFRIVFYSIWLLCSVYWIVSDIRRKHLKKLNRKVKI